MLESLSQPVPPLSTQCLNIRGKLLRRAWDQLHLRDLEDPQLQALEWEQDLLLLIGMQSKNLDLRDMDMKLDMLEPDRISICTWIICWWTPFPSFGSKLGRIRR